jgi:hypothetical protein
MKSKISYSSAKSIYKWITEKNWAEVVFTFELLGRFENILKQGNRIEKYDIELTKEEAEKIISALYSNSGMYDSSVPSDEIKFLRTFVV